MKKAILIFGLILSGFISFAQVDQRLPAYGYELDRLRALRSLQIPSLSQLKVDRKDSLSPQIGVLTSAPTKLQLYDPVSKTWAEVGGGGNIGITKVGVSPFGLIRDNDSTYKADSGQLSTIPNRDKLKDSLKVAIDGKADTIDMFRIDTAGSADGDAAILDKLNNKVIFRTPTGSNNIGDLKFKIGDLYAPAVGTKTLINSYFFNRLLFVFRDGELQDTSAYTHIDSTLEFMTEFTDNEPFRILARDLIGVTTLSLEDHTPPAADPIAYVSSSVGAFGYGTSSTFSFTTSSGSNRMLIVTFTGETKSLADDITGVTYNGVSMTLGVKQEPSQSGDRWSYIYYLKDPASGAHNVVISRSTAGYMISNVAEYTGVNTVESNVTNTCGCSNLTTNFTTVADNCWIVTGITSPGTAITGYSGITKRQSSTDYNSLFDSNGPLTPAGAKSYSTTGIPSFQTHAALILKPY